MITPPTDQRRRPVSADGVPRTRWLGVATLFTVLAVAATWPQAAEPAGILPHRDSWFNMWRIAWIAHQLPRNPGHVFDANIHHEMSPGPAHD